MSIVTWGGFNPRLVSPAWLEQQDLISTDEGSAVAVEVISTPVAVLRFAWGSFQLTEDQLQVDTLDPMFFGRCRDLALGFFSTLSHTPTAGLSINLWRHLRVDDEKLFHSIGDNLIPKSIWDRVARLPGTETVRIRGVRDDDLGGSVVFTVEPSRKFESSLFLHRTDYFYLVSGVRQPQSRDDLNQDQTMHDDIVQRELSSDKTRVVVEVLGQRWPQLSETATASLDALWRSIREAVIS